MLRCKHTSTHQTNNKCRKGNFLPLQGSTWKLTAKISLHRYRHTGRNRTKLFLQLSVQTRTFTNKFQKHFTMLQCTKNKTQNLKHNKGKHNKLVGENRQKTQQPMNIKSTFCNTPAPLRRTIKTVQDRVSLIIICKLKHRNIFFKKKTLCNVAMYKKTKHLKHNNGKHDKLVGKTDNRHNNQ